MNRIIGQALRDFFSDLVVGDPVALSLVGALLVFAAITCVLWFVIIRQKNRADARAAQKRKAANDEADKVYKRMKQKGPRTK